jgi:hypothetical protein
MARRDGCRRRCIRLQRLFLDAFEDACVAAGDRHAGPRSALGGNLRSRNGGRDRRPRSVFVGGAIQTPVSHRRHRPFAAIGFASVVSLMPGLYIFRMASGLVQIAGASPTTPALLSEIISSGMTALMIVLAMSLGLIVPKMLIESVYEKRLRTRSLTKKHADVR